MMKIVSFVVVWTARIAFAIARAWKRKVDVMGNATDYDQRWTVTFSGIQWDDGKGEYDVSWLPKTVIISVLAYDQKEALDIAMHETSDLYGSLIDEIRSYKIVPHMGKR